MNASGVDLISLFGMKKRRPQTKDGPGSQGKGIPYLL
jgi:hypothetical protein